VSSCRDSLLGVLERETVLELARLLNEVVVSGDRIGSTFHDRLTECDREFGTYCRELAVVSRAAALRGQLSEALWPDAPPEDDERIEAELAPRYWKP
jgi:hypothetical protein